MISRKIDSMMICQPIATVTFVGASALPLCIDLNDKPWLPTTPPKVLALLVSVVIFGQFRANELQKVDLRKLGDVLVI